MTNEEYDDVRHLWALIHAGWDFEQVGDFCDDLLNQNVDRRSSLYRALLTAIFVAYGRPFKGNSKMKITEEFVPNNEKELHEKILQQRDRMYAHTDKKGLPFYDHGHVHRVTIARQIGGRHFSTDTIISLPSTVIKVKALSADLLRIVGNKRDELMNKHEAKIPIGGAYFLNVTDPAGPFVQSVAAELPKRS